MWVRVNREERMRRKGAQRIALGDDRRLSFEDRQTAYHVWREVNIAVWS